MRATIMCSAVAAGVAVAVLRHRARWPRRIDVARAEAFAQGRKAEQAAQEAVHSQLPPDPLPTMAELARTHGWTSGSATFRTDMPAEWAEQVTFRADEGAGVLGSDTTPWWERAWPEPDRLEDDSLWLGEEGR